MAQKYVQKSITMPKEYDTWLRKNCISPSKFFQKYIALEMAAQNRLKNVEPPTKETKEKQ